MARMNSGCSTANYDSIPASAQKQQALASIQFALSGSGGGMPDFTIGITPASQTVTAGSSATYTVTLAASNGFSGAVNLAASGLPPGVSAAFSSSQVNLPATATLTLAASSSVTPGSYVVTVTGTAGTLTHSSAAYIVVQAAPVPDFSLSASPGAQSVTAGSQVNWTISSAPQNGFAGSVGLSVGGLPMGAEAIFTPASISGAGNSSLTIKSTSQTAAGSYQLTVTGTSGSLQHSLPLDAQRVAGKRRRRMHCDLAGLQRLGRRFCCRSDFAEQHGGRDIELDPRLDVQREPADHESLERRMTQAGEAVTVANAPYNGSIANGGNTQLGFQAAYSGRNLKPSVISMNGTSCVVQ